MKPIFRRAIPAVFASWMAISWMAVSAVAQSAAPQQPAPPPPPATSSPVVLDWTPPALSQLSTLAAVKNSFTLDRNMLNAAASIMPDTDEPTRQAINRLDGVSVHMLRFGSMGVPDEDAMNSIREAYHLRGWKHIVTTQANGGPVHDGATDVWVVMDGINLRGAVVLSETAKSVTLVTVAGNLSPVDLLHLRGHFGIPKFDGDELQNQSRR